MALEPHSMLSPSSLGNGDVETFQNGPYNGRGSRKRGILCIRWE